VYSRKNPLGPKNRGVGGEGGESMQDGKTNETPGKKKSSSNNENTQSARSAQRNFGPHANRRGKEKCDGDEREKLCPRTGRQGVSKKNNRKKTREAKKRERIRQKPVA